MRRGPVWWRPQASAHYYSPTEMGRQLGRSTGRSPGRTEPTIRVASVEVLDSHRELGGVRRCTTAQPWTSETMGFTKGSHSLRANTKLAKSAVTASQS